MLGSFTSESMTEPSATRIVPLRLNEVSPGGEVKAASSFVIRSTSSATPAAGRPGYTTPLAAALDSDLPNVERSLLRTLLRADWRRASSAAFASLLSAPSAPDSAVPAALSSEANRVPRFLSVPGPSPAIANTRPSTSPCSLGSSESMGVSIPQTPAPAAARLAR